MFTCYNSGQANNQKGPDDQGDDPSIPRLFGKDISDEERREVVMKAYEQLKASFERFKKPDGQKSSPARTCRDLSVAHPELSTGKRNTLLLVPHLVYVIFHIPRTNTQICRTFTLVLLLIYFNSFAFTPSKGVSWTVNSTIVIPKIFLQQFISPI